MGRLSVHILILNYNGADLLERFLPAFRIAIKKTSHPCRVSVVDNLSTDRSGQVVAQYNDVGWISARENRVLCSYNEVARNLSDDILILVNNDIEPDSEFIDPLVAPFRDDPELFMTSPGFYDSEGRLECGRSTGGVRAGLFWSKAVEGPESRMAGLTFSSGMGAFKRSKFLELGGYDDLYLPGTLEDTDLCFRAWKRGWKSLYVPESRLAHLGQVSFKKRFGKWGIKTLNARNLFLFQWKNIREERFMFEHALLLVPRLLAACLTGHAELLVGFLRALPLAVKALARGSRGTLSDSQIFSLFTNRP